jgi:hypothetical protein
MTIVVEAQAQPAGNGQTGVPPIVVTKPRELAVNANWLDSRDYRREAAVLRGRLAAAMRCIFCGQKLTGERSRQVGAGKHCRAKYGF